MWVPGGVRVQEALPDPTVDGTDATQLFARALSDLVVVAPD